MTLNFAFVGISSRTLAWKGYMVYEHRHYLEVCFVLALYVGISLHALVDVAWVRTALSHRLAGWLVAAVLAAHAAASFRALRPMLVAQRFYVDMPRSRLFLKNLTGDIRRLRRTKPSDLAFLDDAFPPYLDPLDFTFRRYSQLLPVLGLDARFAPPGRARFLVLENGHIARIPRHR